MGVADPGCYWKTPKSKGPKSKRVSACGTLIFGVWDLVLGIFLIPGVAPGRLGAGFETTNTWVHRNQR